MDQVKKILSFQVFPIQEYTSGVFHECFSTKWVPLYFVLPVMNSGMETRLQRAKITDLE